MDKLTPTQLSDAVDISVPYASQLLADPPKRSPSLRMAIRIYDKFGLKLGALANLADADIETARRMAA